MRPTSFRVTSAFTLIELLTVIAIIGILAAIVIPTVGSVREKAQRAVDANNLREIAKAAMIYAADNNDRLPDPDAAGNLNASARVFLWPGILARTGALTDPSLYFSKVDAQYSGVLPTAILNPGNRNALDPSFTDGRELSFEFVGGLKMSDPASTPVAFTRGLRTSGTWDPQNSVYGDTGGYVVYLGGNVEFYPDTATGKFINAITGQRTDNLLEALPNRSGIKVWGTTRAGIGTPGGTSR